MFVFIFHHRLAKEKTVYEQEVVTQTAHIEKMKVAGKDEHDIRKQVHWSSLLVRQESISAYTRTEFLHNLLLFICLKVKLVKMSIVSALVSNILSHSTHDFIVDTLCSF